MTGTGDYIRNNKLKAYHAGFSGNTGRAVYQIRYTYSENYGTNFYPFSKKLNQHSFIGEFYLPKIKLFEGNLKFMLAFDTGDLYGENYGILLTFSRDF
ncbi:MAG: hypothetical protein HC830_08540 [Bacteroidetes bacterium]|nr:hypothetical protein [Bacteroidota bacterium]